MIEWQRLRTENMMSVQNRARQSGQAMALAGEALGGGLAMLAQGAATLTTGFVRGARNAIADSSLPPPPQPIGARPKPLPIGSSTTVGLKCMKCLNPNLPHHKTGAHTRIKGECIGLPFSVYSTKRAKTPDPTRGGQMVPVRQEEWTPPARGRMPLAPVMSPLQLTDLPIVAGGVSRSVPDLRVHEAPELRAIRAHDGSDPRESSVDTGGLPQPGVYDISTPRERRSDGQPLSSRDFRPKDLPNGDSPEGPGSGQTTYARPASRSGRPVGAPPEPTYSAQQSAKSEVSGDDQRSDPGSGTPERLGAGTPTLEKPSPDRRELVMPASGQSMHSATSIHGKHHSSVTLTGNDVAPPRSGTSLDVRPQADHHGVPMRQPALGGPSSFHIPPWPQNQDHAHAILAQGATVGLQVVGQTPAQVGPIPTIQGGFTTPTASLPGFSSPEEWCHVLGCSIQQLQAVSYTHLTLPTKA